VPTITRYVPTRDVVVNALYRQTVAQMRSGRRFTDFALSGLGLDPVAVRLMVAL